MGDLAPYSHDVAPPLVDHLHERVHQHRSLFQYLTNKSPNPKMYPNHPDIDIRDTKTEYVIEMEVPGLDDPKEIACRWTGLQSLVVSGSIQRPEIATASVNTEAGTGDPKTENVLPDSAEAYLLVGERRIGEFQRHFYFPVEVVMEKLEAKLHAGVLRIRVPKVSHKIPTGNGVIKVERL
jgi:HSP20 family molecular chaperone IbpA